MNELTVNTKKDEFYISVFKKGVHSFVVLGVVKEDTPYPLLRVGKNYRNGVSAGFLVDESEKGYNNTTYNAYAISYQQYEAFTAFLSKAHYLQNNHKDVKYRCLLKVNDSNTDEIKLVKTTLHHGDTNDLNIEQVAIIKESETSVLNFTCRYVALRLLEHVQNSKEAVKHLSSCFFIDFLIGFQTNKQPSPYFYVMPAPPSAYLQGDTEAKRIMLLIFSRMHHLLAKDPYSQTTIDKFKSLKSLYKICAKSKPDELREAILTWDKEHRDKISPLRQQSLFGKMVSLFTTYQSTTEIMIDRIKARLQPLP